MKEKNDAVSIGHQGTYANSIYSAQFAKEDLFFLAFLHSFLRSLLLIEPSLPFQGSIGHRAQRAVSNWCASFLVVANLHYLICPARHRPLPGGGWVARGPGLDVGQLKCGRDPVTCNVCTCSFSCSIRKYILLLYFYLIIN